MIKGAQNASWFFRTITLEHRNGPTSTIEFKADVVETERVLRAAAAAAIGTAALSGAASTPGGIFFSSVLSIYLMQTAIVGRDPLYSATARLRLAHRSQVWQHTVATGTLVPLAAVGDLVSSATVFILSAVGGLFAMLGLIGRDGWEAAGRLRLIAARASSSRKRRAAGIAQ